MRLEYTSAPRATPVIHDGLVYLLGALGDLHCAELTTGKIIWKRQLQTDFDVELPNWGYASPPLIVDDMLIVNPGAAEASIVALDRKSGKVVWKTPGHAAAYAPFLVGTFGGVRQIIGYDVAGLGGWDPKTGKRLWDVIPKGRTDFNVGTPVIIDGKMLVATENNDTRLYEFDEKGHLKPEPILVNHELAPDTCTPVVLGGRVFCTAYGEMYCLDLKNELKTVWKVLDDYFYEHTNLIAGNGRILVWTTSADLLLVDATANEFKPLAKLRPFAGDDVESMSHPALVGDRLYLRDSKTLKCFRLPKPDANRSQSQRKQSTATNTKPNPSGDE